MARRRKRRRESNQPTGQVSHSGAVWFNSVAPRLDEVPEVLRSALGLNFSVRSVFFHIMRILNGLPSSDSEDVADVALLCELEGWCTVWLLAAQGMMDAVIGLHRVRGGELVERVDDYRQTFDALPLSVRESVWSALTGGQEDHALLDSLEILVNRQPDWRYPADSDECFRSSVTGS